jgi:DNA repair protein RadC
MLNPSLCGALETLLPGLAVSTVAGLQARLMRPDRADLLALRTVVEALIAPPAGTVVDRAAVIDRLLAPRLAFAGREALWVVALDGAHRIIDVRRLSEGDLRSCSLAPRRLAEVLIEVGAAAFVLVHNHPSGDPAPSAQDRHLTASLAPTFAALGMPMLDHLVIARSGYASAMHRGPTEHRAWLKLSA